MASSRMKIHRVILMGSGELLNLEEPKADQLTIHDIARSLSRLPRFCGHTREPYSVAQHCVFVSDMLKDTPYAYEGLMHELSEACGLGDVASPMKKMLGKQARKVINQFESKLCGLFDVEYPFPKEVHLADARALVTEFRQLFPSVCDETAEKWLKGFTSIQPYKIKIRPVDADKAYRMFMKRYEELRP